MSVSNFYFFYYSLILNLRNMQETYAISNLSLVYYNEVRDNSASGMRLKEVML
jgi:hypothetical protein